GLGASLLPSLGRRRGRSGRSRWARHRPRRAGPEDVMAAPSAGSVVAWLDGDGVAFGVVLGEEKQRVLVLTASGREERITPSRIAATLSGGTPPGKAADARSAASARAASAERELRAKADAVDVPTLWELAN